MRRLHGLMVSLVVLFAASMLLVAHWTAMPGPMGEGAGPAQRPEPAVRAATAEAPGVEPPAGDVASAPSMAPARGPAASAALAHIDFSFRLDPRLTSGLHMGPRWVSPATYSRTGPGTRVPIEARAHVRADGGRQRGAAPTWSPEAPDMLEVTPEVGEEVTIIVARAGESALRVSVEGATRTLMVRAVEAAGGLQIAITQ